MFNFIRLFKSHRFTWYNLCVVSSSSLFFFFFFFLLGFGYGWVSLYIEQGIQTQRIVLPSWYSSDTTDTGKRKIKIVD